MPASIANINGVDCFAAVGQREDVWHLLGQYKVPTDGKQGLTADEMIDLAGLGWSVVKVQNYARNAKGVVVPVNSASIFRDIDSMELGQVGLDFAIKQNRDCFRFIDTLLEANGGSHFDTAGALGNGSKVFVSVRVPKADINIGNDSMKASLIFATAHDGSMAHTVKLSEIRPVCANTLDMALSGSGEMFRVKHTKNAESRLDRAKDLMQGVVQNAKTLEEKLRLLASRKITKDSLKSILDRLFPPPKEENANTTRRENVLADVLSLYESNDKNAFPEMRGTAYNLLNAVTEYTDHVRTARITDNREGYTLQQARAENAVVGTGATLKSKALEVIEMLTVGAPMHSVLVSRPIEHKEATGGSLLDDVLANHEN